jgi:hypothetical protein
VQTLGARGPGLRGHGVRLPRAQARKNFVQKRQNGKPLQTRSGSGVARGGRDGGNFAKAMSRRL